MTVPGMWQKACGLWSSNTALVSSDTEVSYAQLERMVDEYSAFLAATADLPGGGVVALYLNNSVDFVVGYLAIVSSGLVCQPIDVRINPAELAQVLEDSGADVVIADAQEADAVRAIAGEINANLQVVLPYSADGRAEASRDPAGTNTVTADSVAELMYTSGSQGRPKAVMRTHGNVCAAAGNSLEGFGYQPDDKLLIAMPLSHSSALVSQLLPMLAAGGTVVLLTEFDRDRFADECSRRSISCFRAVPTMLEMLLTLDAFDSDHLPGLRLIINSSAPVNPATLARLKKRFPETDVMNSYGLTEASTCTVLTDSDLAEKPGSIGRPIGSVRMRVYSESGEREASTDEEGEIQIQGDHVFLGYKDKEELTRNAFMDGWLRSGDRGTRDSDGFYYYAGRTDNMINCAGNSFSPAEVEEVIAEIDGVEDVAVIGIEHRQLGQVAKAIVVLRESATIGPVKSECRKRLPSFKVPFSFEQASSIPRNRLGKLVRASLPESGSS